jgi:hypothetical protein
VTQKSLFCLLLLCSTLALADDVQVACPMGLIWTNDGYCFKKLDNKKGQMCPSQSKLDKPSITAEAMCMAKGRCPEGMTPEKSGVCRDIKSTKEHPFPFKQKQTL